VEGLNILIIDDEEAVREGLRMVIEYGGMNVDEALTGEEGLKRIEDGAFDVVLLDLRLPGIDGLEVLDRITKLDLRPEVIMISAHADLSVAVNATRKGAFDFLEKPLDHDRLLLTVRNAGRQYRLGREATVLRETLPGVDNIMGVSESIRELKEVILRVAPTDSRVLITGESGTGKELVARAIHALSPRSNEIFVEINCASIPSELIESELFGHEKGAFTGASARRDGRFEQADRGTLFLDEVADMSQAAQAKMLRVLEQGTFTRVGGAKIQGVDVRVIAATNKDVEKEVAEGRLREDLFYRLNVVRVHVVPLREREQRISESWPFIFSINSLPRWVDHHSRYRRIRWLCLSINRGPVMLGNSGMSWKELLFFAWAPQWGQRMFSASSIDPQIEGRNSRHSRERMKNSWTGQRQDFLREDYKKVPGTSQGQQKNSGCRDQISTRSSRSTICNDLRNNCPYLRTGGDAGRTI